MPAASQQVAIGKGSVATAVTTLRPGEFVWVPQVAPAGPMLLIVNLRSQRALLFRNGLPIAATTVSTGRPGYRTPTGVFTILQKAVDHRSSTYDNAPMPYMQRLTWKGVALHAGRLPGYPASHGCIRLPPAFAKLLYGVTSYGMTVVITDAPSAPRIAPKPDLLADRTIDAPVAAAGVARGEAPFDWHPERAPAGPVSIVVSSADGKALVLRNGVIIGSAPVSVEGPVTGTWAYTLRASGGDGRQWMRVELSQDSAAGDPVPPTEWQRFRAPVWFRAAVAGIVAPGTTVLVTADSLRAGAAGQPLTIIETEPRTPPS